MKTNKSNKKCFKLNISNLLKLLIKIIAYFFIKIATDLVLEYASLDKLKLLFNYFIDNMF